jgi:hypothetical protein
MPDISLSRARGWLNASERRLAASSRRPALAKISTVELKKKIALARELRDKWRDVFTRQRRERQADRRSRASAENQRSRQKSELFGDVLARFEAQLASVEASPAGRSRRPPARRPSKRSRSTQHRQTRSQVRKALAGHVSARESERARARQAALPPAEKRRQPARGKRPPKKKPKSRPPAGPPAGMDRSQTPFAAKRHRMQVSGLTTRVRGHVSGRGKRNQARRDRRR